MRKPISLFICLMLLLTMAVPGYADNIDVSASDPITIQEGDIQPEENGDQKEDHEHSYTIESDTATCSQDGTVTYKCSCGDQYTETSKATGSHTYGNWMDAGDGKHGKTCSACGNTEKADHSYGEWKPSGDQHIRSCSVCGAADQAAHSWGSATVVVKPTCKDVGYMGYTCSVCKYEYLDKEKPIDKLTVHTYDSACDPYCNVCNAGRTIEHTYSTTWSKDSSGHWHECTKCGDKKDESKHSAGPEATEEKDQVCLTCSYIIAAKKKHVHSYGTEWTSDEVGHWHACTGCDEEKNYASHSYDNACDPDCNTCSYVRENSHS